MKTIRIALAQMNPTVGDLKGNVEKIRAGIAAAKRKKADLVAFPELSVTGYPPEDLVLKPQFVRENLAAVQRLCRSASGITAVIGFVDRKEDGLLNAAAVLSGGEVVDIYHKMILPNYGVFDEHRYFREGRRAPVYLIRGVRVGVNICEDIWHRCGPAQLQARAGAELIVNINASPYEMGKQGVRERILFERATENRLTIAYLNTVGGQDELVFDGGSLVVDPDGRVIATARQFEEDLLVVDLETGVRRRQMRADVKPAVRTSHRTPVIRVNGPAARIGRKSTAAPMHGRMGSTEEVYHALVLGTADYVRKNRFNGVVVGMSGGVDSSLVASIAADALGPHRVKGVFMPSRYTSQESREDAFGLCRNLGIGIFDIPIDALFSEYLDALSGHFMGRLPDVTEENLQARIRGNLLMAFSNKFGWLVLTTGNKSEMSVGYATLYGDMAGGFAVIKDVPKTLVYGLCRWKNESAGREIVPQRVLVKPPTAELRPDQKDTDSLPAYEVLDPILKAYVEDAKSAGEIIRLGHDAQDVRRVIGMVDRSEYKRRQAPPGVKITSRAFGRDWRFPITNRYRSE